MSLLQIARIDDRIARHKGTIDKLLGSRKELVKKYKIRCGKCGQRSMLSEWVFRQAIWYVPPRGCTEGAYWKNDDPQSRFVCPECDAAYRVYDQEKSLQKLILDARSLMKKGEDYEI